MDLPFWSMRSSFFLSIRSIVVFDQGVVVVHASYEYLGYVCKEQLFGVHWLAIVGRLLRQAFDIANSFARLQDETGSWLFLCKRGMQPESKAVRPKNARQGFVGLKAFLKQCSRSKSGNNLTKSYHISWPEDSRDAHNNHRDDST
jgi:hypothetical protein